MVCSREARPESASRSLPALVASRIFQDWGGLDASDCALGEINVEPHDVVVFNSLKFHGVASGKGGRGGKRGGGAGCVGGRICVGSKAGGGAG